MTDLNRVSDCHLVSVLPEKQTYFCTVLLGMALLVLLSESFPTPPPHTHRTPSTRDSAATQALPIARAVRTESESSSAWLLMKSI